MKTKIWEDSIKMYFRKLHSEDVKWFRVRSSGGLWYYFIVSLTSASTVKENIYHLFQLQFILSN
jgi:hypothetical protein